MIKTLSIILTILFLLTSCNNNNSSTEKKGTITIEEKSLSSALYFSGIIQPLRSVVVTSPADGVVESMAFHYGDTVKVNQPLFIVSSEKFKTDYKNALMQYIKAKNDFSNARSSLSESQFLHKNQLISDDDFKSKQSTYYNAQLSLVQAQDALVSMLKQLAVTGVNLDQLTIENIGKITQAMNVQGGSQKLRIIAPVSGVALLSSKSSGAEDIKKIEQGDQIKQGDVLAVIGDVNGLTIHVSVNEFNINQLQIGQKVKVTGAAFPEITLEGKITGLDHQGQSANGGMPVFPVEIVVPHLTTAQQAIIHMGMSAKVEVDIEQAKQITIPISAIEMKNNAAFVKIQDTHSGKVREIPVKTGQTTLDSVVIESGLQKGDEVVVPH